jgi:hypothetical protein
MTIKEYNEMKARHNGKQRKKPAHDESAMQRACVEWFRLQYHHLGRMIFAVPNGGHRNAREAAIMKAEGVTAGVADVILLIGNGTYNCLCIEFKTEKGKQTKLQKEWQKEAENAGNKYVICRSIDNFIHEIKNYLK